MTGRSEIDFDLLADYAGGALDGTPEADRIGRLIDSDGSWRRQYELLTAALEAVEADLGRIAGESAMPDDIAARFDELLAGPQLATVATVRHSAVGERALTRRAAPAVKSSRRSGWRRWAAPISIAAGVLAFAGLAVPPMLADGLDAGSTLADAPADAPEISQQQKRPFDAAGGVPPVTFSGTDYTRDMLSSNAKRATGSHNSSQNGLTGQDSTELQELAEKKVLEACLAEMGKALPGTVTALDFAFFEGTAALIASIHAHDGRWALVVGVDCGTRGVDELYRTRTG